GLLPHRMPRRGIRLVGVRRHRMGIGESPGHNAAENWRSREHGGDASGAFGHRYGRRSRTVPTNRIMKILTSQQMANIDRRTTESFGIPSIVLMENAALAVIDAIQ